MPAAWTFFEISARPLGYLTRSSRSQLPTPVNQSPDPFAGTVVPRRVEVEQFDSQAGSDRDFGQHPCLDPVGFGAPNVVAHPGKFRGSRGHDPAKMIVECSQGIFDVAVTHAQEHPRRLHRRLARHGMFSRFQTAKQPDSIRAWFQLHFPIALPLHAQKKNLFRFGILDGDPAGALWVVPNPRRKPLLRPKTAFCGIGATIQGVDLQVFRSNR